MRDQASRITLTRDTFLTQAAYIPRCANYCFWHSITLVIDTLYTHVHTQPGRYNTETLLHSDLASLQI